jgi:hypothetical protein
MPSMLGDPGLVQSHDVMSLMSHLTGQDSEQLTHHIHSDPLLLGGQNMSDPPQIADREAE